MNRTFAYEKVSPIRLDQVEVRAVVALDHTNLRLFDLRTNNCLRQWIGLKYGAAVAAGELDPSSPVNLLVSAHETYVREKTNGQMYSGARA